MRVITNAVYGAAPVAEPKVQFGERSAHFLSKE
jgi:hypothetical protein